MERIGKVTTIKKGLECIKGSFQTVVNMVLPVVQAPNTKKKYSSWLNESNIQSFKKMANEN